MSSAATFKISNVYTTGTITGDNESAAISGWAYGSDIQNAYSISAVTGVQGDNTMFRGDPSNANIFDINGKQGTAITAEQAASGELAYKFNEAAGKTVLYQKIGEDAYPTFDASRGEVYSDGKGNYFNASLVQNEKGQYEISNSIQLVLFSNLVNSGATSAKAILTADIDMSNVPNFTPIGLYSDDASYPRFTYSGVFDGQGHIIRNLTITREDKYETGLFSRTQSATVMNLGVENATITNTEGIRAGVFGGEMYVSTIKNLFSVGEIVVNTTKDQKSGIAGEAFQTTLQNCYTTFDVAANNTNPYSNTFQGEEVAQGISTGELCVKLNGGSSDNPIYFQTLGQDAYPVLTNTSKIVFQDGETYTNEYPAWYLLKELIAASEALAASTKIINETLMARLLNKPGEKDLQTAALKFTDDYTTSYKNTMLPLYNQDRNDTAKIAWYEYHYLVEATTQQGTAHTLSYLATVDYYEGGAHGINQLITFNFDIATGKLITLADVFAPGYESQLKTSLMKALKSKTGLNSINELKDAGYLYSMDMFPSENFILNDETITFVYNPYEIAPYAVGSIELVITYNEVSQILNPSFKH